MTTQLRIGDAERDSAVERLGEHFAAGRLSKDEFEERSAKVTAARYDDDIRPLFADLPGPGSEPTGVAAIAGGWPGSREGSGSGERSGSREWPGRDWRGQDWRGRDWAAREWRAGAPPWAQGARSRRGGPPPFVPLFVVAMVIAAAVFITPWLLFGLFWVACAAGGANRHRMHTSAATGGGYGPPTR